MKQGFSSQSLIHPCGTEKLPNNFVYCIPGLLTKKFINLIKHAEDGILDLNKAADTLEVTVLLVKLIPPYMITFSY